MLTGCVLITGTSRGIGLEFVRQLVKRSSITPKHIIATCRNPNEATDLLQLRDQHPEVVVVKELDITEYDKLKGFVKDIKVAAFSTVAPTPYALTNLTCCSH